jgi:hypothetical protein
MNGLESDTSTLRRTRHRHHIRIVLRCLVIRCFHDTNGISDTKSLTDESVSRDSTKVNLNSQCNADDKAAKLKSVNAIRHMFKCLQHPGSSLGDTQKRLSGLIGVLNTVDTGDWKGERQDAEQLCELLFQLSAEFIELALVCGTTGLLRSRLLGLAVRQLDAGDERLG